MVLLYDKRGRNLIGCFVGCRLVYNKNLNDILHREINKNSELMRGSEFGMLAAKT